jgi:hypothetical protein
MFIINDHLDLEDLFSISIKKYVYPIDLPAFLGQAPPGYVKWLPIVKWFRNDYEKKVQYFDNFYQEFYDRLHGMNCVGKCPVKEWSSINYSIRYIISEYPRNDPENFNAPIKIDKLVCRIDHQPDNAKSSDGKRIDWSILSSTNDQHVYKNYLDSLGVKIVCLGERSILCYRVIFASTLTRFYRFWYLDPSRSSFAVLSWCKIAYAYNIQESMELIPYPKVLVILMDETPDLEEIIDIFRIFNFMDTEAWIFPIEIEYGRINFSSQAEFSRAILKRKATEIKKEETDVISELSVSQEKSKSLDKNNIKKKRIIKRRSIVLVTMI